MMSRPLYTFYLLGFIFLLCCISSTFAYDTLTSTPITEDSSFNFYGYIALKDSDDPFSVIKSLTLSATEQQDYHFRQVTFDVFLMPSGVAISDAHDTFNVQDNKIEMEWDHIPFTDISPNERVLMIQGSIVVELLDTPEHPDAPVFTAEMIIKYNNDIQTPLTITTTPLIAPGKSSTNGSRDLIALTSRSPKLFNQYTHSFVFPAVYNPGNVQIDAFSVSLGGTWFYNTTQLPTLRCSVMGSNPFDLSVTLTDCLPDGYLMCKTMIYDIKSNARIKLPHNLPVDIACTGSEHFFSSTEPTQGFPSPRNRNPYTADITLSLLTRKSTQYLMIDTITARNHHLVSTISAANLPQSTIVRSYSRPSSQQGCTDDIFTTLTFDYGSHASPQWGSTDAIITSLHNIQIDRDSKIETIVYLPGLASDDHNIANHTDIVDHIVYNNTIVQEEKFFNEYAITTPFAKLFSGKPEEGSYYKSSKVSSFIVTSSYCVNRIDDGINDSTYSVVPILSIAVTDLYSNETTQALVPLNGVSHVNYDWDIHLDPEILQPRSRLHYFSEKQMVDIVLIPGKDKHFTSFKLILDATYNPKISTSILMHSPVNSTMFNFRALTRRGTWNCTTTANGVAVEAQASIIKDVVDFTLLSDLADLILPAGLLPGVEYLISCPVAFERVFHHPKNMKTVSVVFVATQTDSVETGYDHAVNWATMANPTPLPGETGGIGVGWIIAIAVVLLVFIGGTTFYCCAKKNTPKTGESEPLRGSVNH